MQKSSRRIATVALCLALITVGVGTAIGSPTSADLGAGYLAYEAYQGDLSSDSALENAEYITGGVAAVGSGYMVASAGTSAGATGATALAGAGLSAGLIGGGVALAA